MELVVSKVLAMSAIFVTFLTSVLLPSKMPGCLGKRQGFLTPCTCLGGGVFLGTYMLVLSPRTRALLEPSLLLHHGIHYPVPEVIAGGGFFLVLFLEFFINLIQRHCDVTPSHACANATEKKYRAKTNGKFGVSNEGFSPDKIIKGDAQAIHAGMTSADDVFLLRKEHSLVSALRSIILMVALSVHNFFRATDLGRKDDVTSVWLSFSAIIAQGSVISFCLGLELMRTQNRKFVLLASGVTYAVTSAIGVAAGISLYHTGTGSADTTLVHGILLGIVTGVFLYCTFFGLLVSELGDKSRLVLLLCILLGYMIMAGLAAIPEI